MTEERKPTVPEVAPLVRAYYAKPGNGAGGCLHVVLDDGNVEDEFVQDALELARKEGDDDGVALAGLLLRMSRTQRRKLSRIACDPRLDSGGFRLASGLLIF